ncbi:Rab3 GTPase-activating protein catalytic subunit [Linum perenne]
MVHKPWKIIPRPLLETILNNHAQHHRVPQPLILHGPRGVGKTTLILDRNHNFSRFIGYPFAFLLSIELCFLFSGLLNDWNKAPHVTGYVDFAESVKEHHPKHGNSFPWSSWSSCDPPKLADCASQLENCLESMAHKAIQLGSISSTQIFSTVTKWHRPDTALRRIILQNSAGSGSKSRNAVSEKVSGSVLWDKAVCALTARSNAKEMDKVLKLGEKGKRKLSVDEAAYYREAMVALRLAKDVVKALQKSRGDAIANLNQSGGFSRSLANSCTDWPCLLLELLSQAAEIDYFQPKLVMNNIEVLKKALLTDDTMVAGAMYHDSLIWRIIALGANERCLPVMLVTSDSSLTILIEALVCSYYSYRAFMDFGFPDIFISRETFGWTPREAELHLVTDYFSNSEWKLIVEVLGPSPRHLFELYALKQSSYYQKVLEEKDNTFEDIIDAYLAYLQIIVVNPAMDKAIAILQKFAEDARTGKIPKDRLRFGSPWRHPPKRDDPSKSSKWAKLQLMDFIQTLANTEFGVNYLADCSLEILDDPCTMALLEVGLLYAQRDPSFIRPISRAVQRCLARWTCCLKLIPGVFNLVTLAQAHNGYQWPIFHRIQMASISKADPSGEDGAEEEELERFDDFTIASSWERFISDIEAVCRQWIADGPKNLLEKGATQLETSQNLYTVKLELKYAMKSYFMEYFFETNTEAKFREWTCPVHDLQLCFGVQEFLVIAPQSASGVVLDSPEASKLLSAVAIALTNCCSSPSKSDPEVLAAQKFGANKGFDPKGHLKCDHCGRRRHTREECWKLIGIPAHLKHKFPETTSNPRANSAVAQTGPLKGEVQETVLPKPNTNSNLQVYTRRRKGTGGARPISVSPAADHPNDSSNDDLDAMVEQNPTAQTSSTIEPSQGKSQPPDPNSDLGLLAAFVPVHDPSRKAFIGIQNMGTIFTRRFETDRVGSQVPLKLMHLEGLYELFVCKFAYSSVDLISYQFKVHFRMKSTYRTFPHDDCEDDYGFAQGLDTQDNDDRGSPHGDGHNRAQWDDDCPWSEWYSAEDPIKGVELIATWSERMVENSLEMAELENTSPHDAEKWVILPIISPNLDSSGGNRIGFASQLILLIDALNISFKAQFIEDFISAENSGPDKLISSMVVPPPTVLDRVLKDLFQGSQIQSSAKLEHKCSRAIKGAPVGSLFAQFCLHCLWVGNCNMRAISVLWIEFIREVRWCWEELQPLPKVQVNGSIDLATCLINQKLQMLAICIERRGELNEDFQDCVGSNDQPDAHKKEDGPLTNDIAISKVSSVQFDRSHDSPSAPDSLCRYETNPSSSRVKPDLNSPDSLRRGSAGVVNSMMLLKSHQSMHAPYTQDPPLMTEDMHEERLQAVEAFGDSFNFSAQLERDVLASDMSAFKAANPDAVFEDFIRWHSRGDWIDDEIEDKVASGRSSLKDYWPPRGRLSQRMSEQGNLWRKIWNDAPALPAYDQKPLLDPNREGEKILHYLETLQPHQLLEQMVCTAFKAAADTLNLTSYGGLNQMTTKIEQLYRTMASALKPLQSNNISNDSEAIDDLKRICLTFEHVEKLLTLAASLHRKFLDAPRLSQSIFTEYYSFYLPKMATGSQSRSHEGFDKQQQVGKNEREVVSNLFKQPTANQKWRKVISMGNLLNGHEPTVREIIFTTHNNNNNNNASNPIGSEDEMETYRMYIAGTSNDLRVALSVTSCD